MSWVTSLQVFPRGSPVVPDLSRAILDLREGHEGFAIQQKWFGDATPSLDYGGRGTDSARLSLKASQACSSSMALC